MNDTASDTAPGPETITHWVDQYGIYLYRFALSLVRSPQVAEDLVQETFLSAVKGWRRFEKRSSGKTWLTAILKHKIVDFFRKDARESPSDYIEAIVDCTETLFSPTGEWTMAPKPWNIDPRQILEQKEFMKQLRQCLAGLSETMARAFVLREIDGLSTPEICDILCISVPNCWVIHYRARMALRKCLEVHWEGADTGIYASALNL